MPAALVALRHGRSCMRPAPTCFGWTCFRPVWPPWLSLESRPPSLVPKSALGSSLAPPAGKYRTPRVLDSPERGSARRLRGRARPRRSRPNRAYTFRSFRTSHGQQRGQLRGVAERPEFELLELLQDRLLVARAHQLAARQRPADPG